MLARSRVNGLACAVGDTCAEGQVNRRISKAPSAKTAAEGLKRRSSDLVDALYIKHAGDFADIGEDGLELAAIGNFQAGVDARVGAIGSAFQAVDVGSGAADYRGNLSQEAGAIAGADHELHLERDSACAAPLDGDPALRLIQQILDVRTRAGMDGDST